MLYDRLAEYYGDGDSEQEQYVKNAERKMDYDKQSELYSQIIEKHAKRYGFPDISFLSKMFGNATPQGGTYKYFWAVCDDCKTEYDFNFNYCPKCFEMGKRNSGYKVKTSNTEYPKSVIRWNMPVLEAPEGIRTCTHCESRTSGYCRGFGNPDWQCSKSDFDYCECKQCCAFYRKVNQNAKRK